MEIFQVDSLMQPTIVNKIAEVFQEVFGSNPWNEGYKCPVCNGIFSLSSHLKICPRCTVVGKHVNLVQYWPKDRVLTYFYSEMIKRDSICLVTYLKSKMLGFAWGHTIVTDENTDAYLSTLKLPNEKYFYLNEVGIIPNEQCKGFGKKLIEEIFSKQSENNVLLKTMPNSQMFNLMMNMGASVISVIPNSNKAVMLLSL